TTRESPCRSGGPGLSADRAAALALEDLLEVNLAHQRRLIRRQLEALEGDGDLETTALEDVALGDELLELRCDWSVERRLLTGHAGHDVGDTRAHRDVDVLGERRGDRAASETVRRVEVVAHELRVVARLLNGLEAEGHSGPREERSRQAP